AAADPRSAGTVPAAVLSLANEALWMMRLNVLKQWSANTLLAAGLVGTVLATAGLRADSVSSKSTEAVVTDASPASAPSEEATVRYDVAFIESPGLSLFTVFKPDYDINYTRAFMFLSDVEVGLLAHLLGGVPGASLEKAESLITRLGSKAVLRIPDNFHKPAWIDRQETSDRPKNVDPPESRDGRKREGCEVRLSSRLSADGKYHTFQFSVRSLHLVALHTIVGPAGAADKIEVPELTQTDFDQQVTLPASGGGLLLSLGLTRTVDAAGASKIAERLILVRTRKPNAPATTTPPRQ
ncbi:hypothetical protein ACYOEI_29810, partial [Singulisphaera rosea]